MWADEPPNNWVAAFGGPAWTLDDETGRYYLHSFYPEQPDLDWRVPEVREAMGDVIRFWVDRGVDGFRVDALQQLMKDPELRDDPLATKPFVLPLGDEYGRLEHVHSEAGPEIGVALQAMREAAGDALLVGEVYRPTRDLGPYLEHLDLAFAFELLHAPFDEERLAEVVSRGPERRAGSRGRSRTTTSPASRPGSAKRTRPARRSSCCRCQGPSSSTRGTRSGWWTARRRIRRTTAPAATRTATPCSGSPSRSADSRPASLG